MGYNGERATTAFVARRNESRYVGILCQDIGGKNARKYSLWEVRMYVNTHV